MSRKALGSIALVLAAAGCSAPAAAPPAGPRGAGQPPAGAAEGNPRFFQVVPDEAFWVTHDAARDRVISTGARLELSPSGEVLAAAWEGDKAHNGDILLGGLALAPHLGGGYLFWTQSRVFRSADFTGPLAPVGLGCADAADTVIRGVRNGLRGAVIATDAGPRELLPGADVATPFPDPGMTDFAALDASRAVRIDALGRTAWTIDGGKTWSDATQITGLGVRNLGVSPDELWFETYNGRAVLAKDGTLTEPSGNQYRYVDYARPFQMVIRGTRADRDDQFWWGYREMQPLQAAMASGARLPDGSALGVVRGAVTRVDLATGRVLDIHTDWLPNGIDCQPLPMDGEILFACAWDDYQAGGYVLRSRGAEPPRVERLFTDDGAFVTDDAGGLGYTGSCKAEQRFVDPDRYYGRYGRYGYDEGNEKLDVDPVFCVRRGPDDWVERRLALDADTSLLAWIPRKDGTAVALVRGSGRGEALPDAARGSQRETEQNGVRVLRVFRQAEGWYWLPQQVRSYYRRGGGSQSLLDHRYRVLDDGTVVGWLGSTESVDDSYRYSRYGSQSPPRYAGAALRPDGRTEVFALPAEPQAMAATGPWGVLTTREGALFETLDRGRTWRPAGSTPLLPGTMTGVCSALGCAFATGARVGWGEPPASPRIDAEPRAEPPAGKLFVPALACEPQGAPRAEQSTLSPAAATLGSQAKLVLQTQFGATLELIRETPDAVSSASAYAYPHHGYPPPAPAPAATASAAPSARPAAKAAPVRTHTLVFRPPLDPVAPIVRHNATNAAISGYRGRSQALTLLGPGADVSYMFFADQNEALVDRNDIVTVPPFETRRYYYYNNQASSTGLRTANDRALLLGDYRSRSAWSSLEEHGAAPQKPPFYFAYDRDANRRRVATMGRRDDGAVGVIVIDGAAPDTAAVAEFDRVASTLGPLRRLAPWSSLLTADDPACGADRTAYRALVTIDPSVVFSLDPAKLPGVELAKQGLLLVRWGEERVCLEAVDLAVTDPRRRTESATGENLVIRWAPAGKGAAAPPGEAAGALRSLELTQPLACSLSRPAK